MTGTFLRTELPGVDHDYVSDDGLTYRVKFQAKYTLASGLPLSTVFTTPRYPHKRKFLRHIYIASTETLPTAGRMHRRMVPCREFTTASPAVDPGTIDGLTGWVHHNQIGEVVKQ